MARNGKPREKKIALARAQRQARIPAEKLLWRTLRNRAMADFKFRRQHPIGPYVVDFACVEAKLVVEIDGESHLSTRREDAKRTQKLEAAGWLVLRFWSTEVYDELEPVMEMIYRMCVQRASEGVPPSPPAPLPPPATILQATSPSRRGERGDRRAVLVAVCLLLIGSAAHAQPSYSKDIRPFLAKYCVECHNAKTLKGTLDLDTHKALMDGSDAGAVVKAGKPDESKLVLLAEHKGKPTMPPPKAKFQPTKDEVKLLRAWVLAGAKDDAVIVKVELPAIKARTDVLSPVTALLYWPEAKHLIVARNDRMTHIFMRFEPPVLDPYDTKGKGIVTALAVARKKFTPHTVLAALSQSGGRSNVAVDTGVDMVGKHPPHSETILDLIADPTGRWLASASYDTQIHLKEWQGNNAHILKEHSDAVYGLAFNPNGTLLASVSADRAMKVWDVETGKLLYTLGEATDWLYTVAWSPNGKYLVSGGVDKSIRVYEALTPNPSPKGRGEWKDGARLRQSVFAHEGPVQKVLFSSDSKTLYSVGQDRVIKAWDVDKMVERKVYDKQPETVLCMALREDAGQIIIGRYDGIVQLIDMKSGKVVHEFGKTKAEKKSSALPHSWRQDSDLAVFCESSARSESCRHEVGQTDKPAPQIPGSSPASGQKITLPAKLDGTLERAGAVHFYRFDAKKGQPLGVKLETKELSSKIEPSLILTDMAGRILAESYEGHLGHTFDKAGSYALGVRDRDYRGGADFKYRLQIGKIPVITSVFPLGVQRGKETLITVDGVFLPKNLFPLAVPADAKIGQLIPLDVGAGVLGKAQVVVGEHPEVTNFFEFSPKIPVPGTANGRLPEEKVQVWRFDARKGQRLIIEVNARRLGSPLDSVIELFDKNNQPVPRAVLRSQAKTHVTFRDHDSAQGNIRIEAWSELGINDFLFVGSELMKIQALPTHPDADCNFFAGAGQRIGYLDTTPTHHANNTPMYKVNVHPPGTTFPPNGYPVFTLFYRNDDGGLGYGRDSRLLFDPPADGEYKVRITDARGRDGIDFSYRLTVRPPRPSFHVRFAPAAPVVSNFNAVPFAISVDRFDGFDGPIAIRFENLPPGFSAPATTIEAGTFSTTVALHASVLAPSAPPKLPMKVIGEVIIDGKKQTHEAIVPAPKVIEEGDIRTWTDEAEVTLKAGQQAKLIVHIERKTGFTGRVPLDVKGLPHGVRVLDIGLNGILVNENETTRTVVLYAEPWVQAQVHPFVVLARHEGKKTEHAAKSVMLRVK